MKIVTTSDAHGNLPTINNSCDIFICGGDKFPNSTRMWGEDGEFQLKWAKQHYFPWIQKIRANRIYSIMGNHDGVLTTNNEISQEFRSLCKQNNIILLEDSGDSYQGFNIWGSPLSFDPDFIGVNWAFGRKTEEELAQEYSKIPHDIDILITHTPPHGILDCGYMKHNGMIEHMGSIALKRRVLEVLPNVHICNHIHEWGGIKVRLGKTLFINSACNVVEFNI